MKSYNIHLIRHGQISEGNQGLYIGSSDVTLSKEGIELLKKYDREMKYPGTPVLYTSPMLRCLQTCQVLYPQIRPTVVQDLREYNFGEWEGKSAGELSESPAFTQWLANSRSVTPPGGENMDDFLKRICLAFENIVNNLIKSGEETAVIVSHAGVLTTLLSVYGLPHGNPYAWSMDNGFGFSAKINTMLWMRDKVMEIYKKIPEKI